MHNSEEQSFHVTLAQCLLVCPLAFCSPRTVNNSLLVFKVVPRKLVKLPDLVDPRNRYQPLTVPCRLYQGILQRVGGATGNVGRGVHSHIRFIKLRVSNKATLESGVHHQKLI